MGDIERSVALSATRPPAAATRWSNLPPAPLGAAAASPSSAAASPTAAAAAAAAAAVVAPPAGSSCARVARMATCSGALRRQSSSAYAPRAAPEAVAGSSTKSAVKSGSRANCSERYPGLAASARSEDHGWYGASACRSLSQSSDGTPCSPRVSSRTWEIHGRCGGDVGEIWRDMGARVEPHRLQRRRREESLRRHGGHAQREQPRLGRVRVRVRVRVRGRVRVRVRVRHVVLDEVRLLDERAFEAAHRHLGLTHGHVHLGRGHG